MTNKERGTFLMINNKMFNSKTGMTERTGTDVDADALCQLFQKLGFKIRRYDDRTVAQMIDVIKAATKEDHTNNDCFALALLSHGDDGIIYGIDDHIPLEFLLAPVKKCSTLAGKPKLFFIQACRGTKLDPGTKVESDSGDQQTIKIPIEADYLYAYSTVPGYFSWRNSLKGSWFVQSLAATYDDVLRQQQQPVDLLKIFTRVNKKVAFEFQSNSSSLNMDKMKQVPYIASTLTKDLYLYPKK
ncbi:hypothetical protein HELRODRAFT_157123 [Helobdella robusta]|uniref:Caspase family p20 domain-containing protein n=1 Tax=Helobdella robusta TaxID=6412 RepID=T1EM65_HELRO|nr:hypothetical protein HELRODRAFT_157123 [Helobdella robusta]ESO03398.1 hypothetical protein HELRODRAFT_157123 [Helobdella robusta]